MSDRVTSLSDWFGDTFRLGFSPPHYWAHCEVRFDVAHALLGLRAGEEVIKYYNEVMDTKGNSTMPAGSSWVTNMRLIWFMPGKRLNLRYEDLDDISIGWRTVTNVFRSKTKPNSVVILASYSTQYEFIFTSEEEHFIETVGATCRGFRKAKLYQETALRSLTLFNNREIMILKNETLFEKLLGVFHLSADIGTIGNLIVTNVRVVWYAADSLSNMSIPYLEITKIQLQKSKYGEVMVINVQTPIKTHSFGFRIDPKEKLHQLEKQIFNLWRIYHDRPIFGVELEDEDTVKIQEESDSAIQSFDELQLTVLNQEEQLNFSTDHLNLVDASDIIFDDYLGLAIQKIPEKTSIKQIWEESF